MTLDRTTGRIALIAIAAFAGLGCGLVSVVYPALRGAGPGLVWGALAVAWLAIGGGAALLWHTDRRRAQGLLLAFIAIPLLMVGYWGGLALLAPVVP